MTLDQSETGAVTPGPAAYERYFVPAIGRPLAEDLVAAAWLRPGERVLDVACGTGIVARLAAEQVAPTGAVAGADIAPGMIAEAKKACAEHPDIAWHETDAAELPLDDASFDAVFCQMGLQFMPARLPALKEMRRVLRPGGRLLVTTPGPLPAIFTVIRDGLAGHVSAKAAGFIDTVFAMHDPDEFVELLRSAGFGRPEAQRTDKSLALPPATDFLWRYLQGAPIGAEVFGKTDAAARAALEAHVGKGCRPFESGAGMALTVGLTTATARK